MNPKVKVLAVNFFLLAIALLALEGVYRVIKFKRSCVEKCDPTIFHWISSKSYWHYEITANDPLLGYVPKPSIEKILNAPGYNNVSLSNDENGLRNSSFYKNDLPKVLTVGDSFAWGAQVSDKDTWQSCLNQTLTDKTFLNAGVGGYGTYQAVLRAEQLNARLRPKYLLVQILVGEDLVRDQMTYRDGFAKPYLTLSHTGSIKDNFPNFADMKTGTKHGGGSNNAVHTIIANLTFLQRIPFVFKQAIASSNLVQARINETAVNPAPLDQILEHSIVKSKQINPRVIWLLQYADHYGEEAARERRMITDKLNLYNVNYIDTYEALYGVDARKAASPLWTPQRHHTPLGNRVVCSTIAQKLPGYIQ